MAMYVVANKPCARASYPSQRLAHNIDFPLGMYSVAKNYAVAIAEWDVYHIATYH